MSLSRLRPALAAALGQAHGRRCLAAAAGGKKKPAKAAAADPASSSSSSEADAGGDGDGGERRTEESPEEKARRQERIARNVRWSGYGLVAAAAGGFALAVLSYGPPHLDESGRPVVDEFTHLPAWRQYPMRTWRELKFWKTWIAEPSRERLLPDPLPEPYIQPKYTLVIELKGILVHPEWTYTTGWRFKKRPAVDYFVRQVGYPNFEVVVYTEETGLTAHPIVDGLDPEQKIMYRLYRDTTKFDGRHHVKDLDKLNRSLKRVIHIDWDASACSLRPENALLLPQWDGGDDDTDLVDLACMLKAIAAADDDDVRPVLAFYNQFDNPAKEFRKRSMQLKTSDAHGGHEADKESGLVGKYAGRLFGFRRHATS